jgi:hypothetical protein
VIQNHIAGSKHVNNPPILHSLESLPVITPFPVNFCTSTTGSLLYQIAKGGPSTLLSGLEKDTNLCKVRDDTCVNGRSRLHKKGWRATGIMRHIEWSCDFW